MCSSPPPGDDEDIPQSISAGQSVGLSDSQEPASSSEVTNHANPSVLRGEVAKAQRLAQRAKLNPYQIEAVENFAKASSLARDVQLFIEICATGNKLDAIVTAAPPFTVSPGLLENIKSYATAVLLSPRLSAYEGSIPCGHVYAIILQQGVYIPVNLEHNAHAKRVVHSEIQEELTQARSRIKKVIKLSIHDSVEASDTIYDLASCIVAHTQCKVTVPLCARLALLRKIYISSSKYWDLVDERLLLIRNKAQKDEKKISRAFERILEADQATYGDRTTYTITNNNDMWQQSIDLVIAGQDDSA
ncbi:hypothetical protein B0H34DRAFT_737147 [Crassisporium funariophilum]|nr:hypothetical protein B0H34DRAFT_737147 [Crassisporium funariophilum]